MAVYKELKQKVMLEITAILENDGTDKKAINSLRKKHPDIPKNTFYRWVQKIKADTGNSPQDIALKVKRRAAVLKRADRKDKVIDNRLTEILPAQIQPDDIHPSRYLDVVSQIKRCVKHAERVLAHCELPDGKIRNPRLYLQASKHILDSMKTAAYVSGQIMDVQKVEQFHQAILNQLKTRDPLLVENILEDLEALNKEWGVV